MLGKYHFPYFKRRNSGLEAWRGEVNIKYQNVKFSYLLSNKQQINSKPNGTHTGWFSCFGKVDKKWGSKEIRKFESLHYIYLSKLIRAL